MANQITAWMQAIEEVNMDEAVVKNWVEGYIKAWQTNTKKDIGALFAKNARYYPRPFAEPWEGREEIVQTWIDHADSPGDYIFRYEVVGTGENTGIVRGWTVYNKPAREYSNMWLIRFDDAGKCTEFTEWWIEKPKAAK